MSYKKQKLLTLREHVGFPPVFAEVRVAHLFSFLCYVVFCFVCLRPVLGVVQCCQCPWIVQSGLPLLFSLYREII
jgi:hypothetical protein